MNTYANSGVLRAGLHSDQGANVDEALFKEDEQVNRLNNSLVKILSKLISDHHQDWGDFVPKAVFAYNTSVHESTEFTPYWLMFSMEAILPLDALLSLEATPSQGLVQT